MFVWVTYILKCSDGTLYTGYTNDLVSRVEKHNAGKGAKYTKGRRPVEVCYTRYWDSKSLAMKFECAIKSKTRAQKLALIGESLFEAVKAEAADLCEGNIGAFVVLQAAYSYFQIKEPTAESAEERFMEFASRLRVANVRGSAIWVEYKDVHGEDIGAFVEAAKQYTDRPAAIRRSRQLKEERSENALI